MNKLMLIVIICILVFLNNDCLSQKNNFKVGYYINTGGDTINGYFQISDWKKLSRIKFKSKVEDNNVSDLDLNNCKSVFVENNSFVSWYGQRHMIHISKMDYEIMYPDSVITERIPLKLLYKGNRLSLYYYEDITAHFFINSEDSIKELLISYRYINTSELTREKIILNKPKYAIYPIFRNQLVAFAGFDLSRKQMEIIENCDYDKSSLIKTVKKIDH